MLIKYHRHGQGMLEALIAIGIILMGLGAIMTLTLKNIAASTDSGQRITAIHLAREAIDAVRGIRDSNWLISSHSDATVKWDDRLVPVPATDGQSAVIKFDIGTLIIEPSYNVDFISTLNISDPAFRMYRDSADHYWIQSATDLSGDPSFKSTGYYRQTLLDPVCQPVSDPVVKEGEAECDSASDKIGVRVTSIVSWPSSGFFGGGSRRSLTLTEFLYNWR